MVFKDALLVAWPINLIKLQASNWILEETQLPFIISSLVSLSFTNCFTCMTSKCGLQANWDGRQASHRASSSGLWWRTEAQEHKELHPESGPKGGERRLRQIASLAVKAGSVLQLILCIRRAALFTVSCNQLYWCGCRKSWLMKFMALSPS